MSRRLRSGYTTGACSAAAAKAAASTLAHGKCDSTTEICFPDGTIHGFKVVYSSCNNNIATASIIKDAGDDPDVTNGATISAEVRPGHLENRGSDCILLDNIQLCRGKGVGVVTKAGLAIPPGEPAINPIPRSMISKAVRDIYPEAPVCVTISIDKGELLAEKTLNHRLGIVGGLSILGTTGIVRPVSADAWTATISASMDVAKEAGLQDIVLSTGRTSEKGAQNILHLPIEAYAMMGDYLEYSIKEAAKKGFARIHLSGMWAKIMKAALEIPQTHVRHGALEIKDGAKLLEELGADGELLTKLYQANSAREMLTHLESEERRELIVEVCRKAQTYAKSVSGLDVKVYLVDHKAQIITHV